MTSTRSAGSASTRSNASCSTSRSAGSIRLCWAGRFRRIVARDPAIVTTGVVDEFVSVVIVDIGAAFRTAPVRGQVNRAGAGVKSSWAFFHPWHAIGQALAIVALFAVAAALPAAAQTVQPLA